METILWVLKRERKINRINIDQLKKKDKRLFEQNITNEIFHALRDFSTIINPFDVMTRFFEKDNSTISQAITVIQLFYKKMKESLMNSSPEIKQIIHEMIRIMLARIKKHYDCNLLKASFLLIMQGKFTIKFPQQPSPFKQVVDFSFTLPVLEIQEGLLYESFLKDSSTAITYDDYMEDDKRDDLHDLEDVERINLQSVEEEDEIDFLFQTPIPLEFLEEFLNEQCEKHDISCENVFTILEYFLFDPKMFF
jgi:hypothetical protein